MESTTIMSSRLCACGKCNKIITSQNPNTRYIHGHNLTGNPRQPKSPEHILKNSESHKGQIAWNKGIKMSQEARDNMSKARKASTKIKRMVNTICTIEGCEKKTYSKEMCQMHKWRVKYYGDPFHERSYETPLDINRYKKTTSVGHPLANSKSGQILQHRKVLFDHMGDIRVPCFWCGAPLNWWGTESPQ
jgi:hypothetical protein